MTVAGVVQAPGGPEEDADGGFAHGGGSHPYFGVEVMGPAIDGVMPGGATVDGLPGLRAYLLRRPEHPVMGGRGGFSAATEEVQRFRKRRELLIVTKANARSTVHRTVPLDYIGVRRFDEAGEAIGEWRFIGLFTSSAYSHSPRDIPLLRRKVRKVIERAGLAARRSTRLWWVNSS